jgi:uncharacterized protein YoxC
MAIIILYLIYYVFSKDSEYNKNIHAVASVVEELNKELYYLKNTTKNITDSNSSINKLPTTSLLRLSLIHVLG